MTPEILNLLFPNPLPDVAAIEVQYPPRQVAGPVLRLAPSPTGFMHVGNFYVALISERIAHQHQGIFYLRLEDTDQSRYIPEAVPLIINALTHYGLHYDEGPLSDSAEKGAYSPYTQSHRKEIYQAYVKKWVAEGKAYPCFCSPEDLEIMRKVQEKQGIRPGYRGKYAKCRDLSDSQVLENLNNGIPFVIRLRSAGNYDHKMTVKDLCKGVLQMPENDLDIPILKRDGLPTYHFAHLIDDHLMGTTHVTRGDEWLSSLPLHLQLFAMMGWTAPQYAHFAPLQKIDENGHKRKLSKRHDPEANICYFWEQGYPQGALLEYLLNIVSSGFEEWRKANPEANAFDYPIDFHKITNVAGALFDFVKLGSISKDIIARMTAEQVYDDLTRWAKEFAPHFYQRLTTHKDYIIRILGIERGIGPKSRKDIVRYGDVERDIAYFFDEGLPPFVERLGMLDAQTAPQVAQDFWVVYRAADDKETWFAKVKEVGVKNGFAPDNKSYKANPDAYKGNVSDVAKILRVLITGREQTPDLYAIMQILGPEEVQKRLTGTK